MSADSTETYYFFLVPPRAPDDTSYEHGAVALAEGLTALGKRVVANLDHWPRPDGTLLFRRDAAVDPARSAAMIFTHHWPREGHAFPAALTAPGRSAATVYLDSEDDMRIISLRRGFPAFDLVLRSHYVRSARYPANFRPWPFGLTERIIASASPDAPKERRIMISHRHTRWPHSVRRYVDRHVVPRLARELPVFRFIEPLGGAPPVQGAADDLLWRLTGRRHSAAFFRELSASGASAAFGGWFTAPWRHDPSTAVSVLTRRVLATTGLRSSQIMQWDSWRLWESFAAASAMVHLDFERYGVVMPVMPRNWEHYIGLDLGDLDRDLARLERDRAVLERVGSGGRAWALEHYAPVPTARRFIALLAEREGRSPIPGG